MRRKPSPEISSRARDVERMIAAGCKPEHRDRAQGLALLILGVELLEDHGVDHATIENLLQQILAAPAQRDDPRSDTTGT